MRHKEIARFLGDDCLKPVVHLHRYKYLWSKCYKRSTVVAAWKKLRKGKTKRREIKQIERNFDHYVRKMQRMMYETRPGGNKDFMFKPHFLRPRSIFEHGKPRLIYCPPIWDQWVHHIVVLVLAPILMKHSYKYTCGSMPKRGGVYGKKRLEHIIRTKGFKYFAKLDIRHFFNSVNIRYVIDKLELLIEDDWFIFLIARVFSQFTDILPLGFYPSQWLANYILSPLDWIISRKRPICYIRYVDDFVICSNNKRFLHDLIHCVKRELGKLRLKLKLNYQVARFDYISAAKSKRVGRSIDYMGFVFKRDRTILRRSILRRVIRFAKRLGKTSVISRSQAHSMLSRFGWFKHTDTGYVWRERIQPYISISALKSIVRKNQRRLWNVSRKQITLV